jgi:hypothetical protein
VRVKSLSGLVATGRGWSSVIVLMITGSFHSLVGYPQ